MPSTTDYTEALLDFLWAKTGVRNKDVTLIRLYASEKQDGDAWSSFFGSLQPATEPYAFNYMLSRLGARFNWNLVPSEYAPMLMGLRRKFVAKNAVLLARALGFIGKLSACEVPVMVVRGGALRMSLLPDEPQKMTDVDIIVPRDLYDDCCALMESYGYECPDFVSHSADFKDKGKSCVDVHFCMFKSNVLHGEPQATMLARFSKVNRGGVEFYVPSPEDAFLNIMVNAVDNFMSLDASKGPLTWLADCIDLSERYELDYSSMIKHACEYGVESQMRVALALMKRFLPDSFSQLHSLGDEPVSLRIYDRIRKAVALVDITGDRALKYSTLKHMSYSLLLAYNEYVCHYCLDEPPWRTIVDFAVLTVRRLKAEQGVEHNWELPVAVYQRTRLWKERKRRKVRMFKSNEEKVFVDSVDGQMVALVIDTGSYYTFNDIATAVITDLNAGYELGEIVLAVQKPDNGEEVLAKLETFVNQLVDKDIVDEIPDAVPAERPAMVCASMDVPSDGFVLEFEGYDDVAEYFLIDPIHEVNPEMGWPHASQE